MTVFSEADLKSRFDTVLETATREGSVRIQRSDGQAYVLRRVDPTRSPLDVGFVDIQPRLTREEIVAAVREGRDREYPWMKDHTEPKPE